MDDSKELIKQIVGKARQAQEQIAEYQQEEIDELCLSVGWEVYHERNIEQLAKFAVRETGMGNYTDKMQKHRAKVLGVIKDICGAKSVGLIEKNVETGISKYAKPVGIVGVLTPVTNPTATPASNAISILKGRNAIIFAPHPLAKRASKLAVDLMREGLARVGAPVDLLQIIEEPSLDKTKHLMEQVDLVLATGGSAMVKAAYSSGTPAYGVGPGNSCQIIAEDADLEDAIKKVTASKTFDHATSCSSENSLIIDQKVYAQVLEQLKKNQGYLCSLAEKEKLAEWMWVPNKKGKLALNSKIIARAASEIAAGAGLSVPAQTKMLIVEGSRPIENDRFSGEKISPVLTLWKSACFEDSLKLLKELTDFAGSGHSCGIHTFNPKYIERLGQEMKISRIMVRQPQAAANGGTFSNGMPSTVTLGCGTWGGNITTENINYRHFLNITWLSEPIKEDKPGDEQVWGQFWQKYDIR